MPAFPWDVAIIGGGPAGSASTISLRQTFPSLRVLLIEASYYGRPRVGEVLAPMARALLAHLGVLSAMSGEVGSPAHGIGCAWGGPRLEETSYFYTASGSGWHLERNRFDAMLGARAEALGAQVWRGTFFRTAERSHRMWRLQFSGGREADARWVIDATGRNAAFARTQGARRNALDALTAFSRIFEDAKPSEARTVVEAGRHGWWYTAPLPNGRRIASLLTDADIGRGLRLIDGECWERELALSSHVGLITRNTSHLSERLVRSAATVTLDRVQDDGWLATGDAAAAFDPLSAQGITNAMRSGILASFAAGDALIREDPSAPARYSAILCAHVAGFARIHREHYARERRWSDQPFWARRQATTINELNQARSRSSLFQSKDEPEGSEGLAKCGFLSFCD